MIRELAQTHTVILSSHILPEVEATCQRIVIIHRGRLVASGSPAELRERIGGESQLIAEVKGAAEQVGAAVREIKGVHDVHSETHDGWTRLSITAKDDVREAVAKLAAQRGWPLRELRRDIATLEDFFVKIVAGVRETGHEA